MRHLLPCCVSVCGRQSDSCAFGKFRPESKCNLLNEPEHGAGFRTGKIGKGGNMATRNHKRMSSIDGANVEKSNRQLILAHAGCAEFL